MPAASDPMEQTDRIPGAGSSLVAMGKKLDKAMAGGKGKGKGGSKGPKGPKVKKEKSKGKGKGPALSATTPKNVRRHDESMRLRESSWWSCSLRV